MTTTETRYVSCADTAKLVRKALKRDFPGVTFSVRSSTYAGGASIDVRWTDGPRAKEVDPTLKQYEGGRFDGMIDMAYSVSHYLRPDGQVLIARDPGTEGQLGSHVGEDNSMLADLMPEGVERVRFAADFIFGHRDVSNYDARKADALDWIYANCNVMRVDPFIRHSGDQFVNTWVDQLADGMVRNYTGDWNRALDDYRYP